MKMVKKPCSPSGIYMKKSKIDKLLDELRDIVTDTEPANVRIKKLRDKIRDFHDKNPVQAGA